MKSMVAHRNKKLNNKGAALISVIVVIAFISVVAALALWMAYMNYYMKITDMKSSDNFYSAEGVVEQIKVGLQTELSDATGVAYNNVLQRYSEFDVNARESYFYSQIITQLRKDLMGPTINEYNIETLRGYVNGEIDEGDTTIVKLDNGDTATITCKSPICLLEVNSSDNSVILRDVNVSYTSAEKGVNTYTSVINTDFVVKAPVIDFSDTSTIPDIFEYVIIADQHLKGTNSICNFTGSVFGGNGSVMLPGETPTEDDESSIILDNHSNWTFNTNLGRVIGGKKIWLNNAAKMTVDETSTLWGDNVNLGDSADKTNNGIELNLLGTAYLADDLTIDGRDCVVKLAGTYCGYGSDTYYQKDKYGKENITEEDDITEMPGDDSSAILVNGKNTSLDLTGLDTLMLSGRSYVGTKKVANVGRGDMKKNQINIPMSESIAVRGNQVAYLVPANALAKFNGESLLPTKRNPMTAADYATYVHPYLESHNPQFVECDIENTTIPGSDYPLSDFVDSTVGPDGSKNYKIQKIFAQGIGGNLIYYYMVMDIASANSFFEKYYGIASNKTKLDSYLDTYIPGGVKMMDTEVSENTRIDIAGSWLQNVMDEEGNPTGEVKLGTPIHSSEDTTTESVTNANVYLALKTKLITNISKVSTSEMEKRLYENLVKKQMVIDEVVGRQITFEDEDSGCTGVVVKGNYDYSNTTDSSGKCRLIICNGNVTVNRNFRGTIISGGTVTVSPGVALCENDSDARMEILKVLQVKDAGDNFHMYEFLVDGSEFAMDEETDKKTTITDFNELVTYENWSKR